MNITTLDDFLSNFKLDTTITYQEFVDRLQVLDISDRTGTWQTRSSLVDFLRRVSKRDDRLDRLELYQRQLYDMIVVNGKQALTQWWQQYVAVDPADDYYNIPRLEVLQHGVFNGRSGARWGRICKNINYRDFYSTKKLYSGDHQWVIGMIQAAFTDYKLRNSMVGPAFFDRTCRMPIGDYRTWWSDFMLGCNRASIFNPVTYGAILREIGSGGCLFAPVMGWNSYQLAYYTSDYSHMIACDVIPGVVDNARDIHRGWSGDGRKFDWFLCPSEELDTRHDFINRYRETVDTVLFSPPYYDLEIYPGEEQSYANYPCYSDWLEKYWMATVRLCWHVMKPGAKFAFVISNYRNIRGEWCDITGDLRTGAEKYFTLVDTYRVQWSARGGSRQAKKTRDGNYETLFVFEKNGTSSNQ